MGDFNHAAVWESVAIDTSKSHIQLEPFAESAADPTMDGWTVWIERLVDGGDVLSRELEWGRTDSADCSFEVSAVIIYQQTNDSWARKTTINISQIESAAPHSFENLSHWRLYRVKFVFQLLKVCRTQVILSI